MKKETEYEKRRGFKFALPNGEILADSAPWIVAQKLVGGEMSRLAEPIPVHEVRLLLDQGFVLSIDGDQPGRWQEILFRPPWFNNYRNRIKQESTLEEVEHLTSIHVSNLLCGFVLAGKNLVAQITRRRIEAGLFAFEDVRDDFPEVFDNANFKDFFAKKFLNDDMPSRKKGKKSQFNPAVIELYELAVSIVFEEKCSWAKACEKAVEQRPDLVPTSWKSDPVGNLIRKEVGKLELSRWTLAGWRKDQD